MNEWTLAPREATEAIACGTHVPILSALANVIKPNRVLELGSGLFSTPLFLDRNVFDSLEFLHVLENDPEWFDAVSNTIGSDDRITYGLVSGRIAPYASRLDISSFDFVFIDDSKSASERAATIAIVASLMSPDAIAVIHDFEEPAYQEAALAFDHQFIFDRWNPATGVCWNGDAYYREMLESLAADLQS